MTDSTSAPPSSGLNFNKTQNSTETYKSVDYFTGIMATINDFLDKKLFCDITLVSNDGSVKIQAHKMMLCASSTYFLAMFGGSMEEATKNEVTLKTIEGSILQIIINYIYTASIELTTDTVEKILIAADLLDLASLKSLCCEFIAKQLDSSNCLGIALFAEQYNLDKLYESAETFVCDNFAKLRMDEEFFKLDAHQLCKFLSSSDIRVDSEEDVFRSLMSWVEHDLINREEYMSKLLHHIRFPLLTPKFIATTIEPICKNIECERLISRAYKWHLLPEFRLSLYTAKQSQLRNFNGMVMAFGGWSNGGGKLNVGFYYPVLNEWIYKTDVPALSLGRVCFGSTTFDGKLIISGGRYVSTNEEVDRVDCLDLKNFTWTSLPPLNRKRQSHKMATVKGCIYAIGGIYNGDYQNTIEKYDPSTKTWTFVAPMTSSTEIKCVSVTMNKLCVSIRCNMSMYSSIARYKHNLYDPDTNTWIDGWLNTQDDLFGTGMVTVIGNHFFIAVGRSSITRYNYMIKSTEVIHIKESFDSANCSYCKAFGDRMIAFGETKFQQYNPFSNEWQPMPKFENTQGRVVLVSNGF